MYLNILQTFQNKQPHRQRKRTEQCRRHDCTGRNLSFMSHILSHNETTTGRRASQHNQNCYQFLIAESHRNGNRQKYHKWNRVE